MLAASSMNRSADGGVPQAVVERTFAGEVQVGPGGERVDPECVLGGRAIEHRIELREFAFIER